jgi:hypothetical protein
MGIVRYAYECVRCRRRRCRPLADAAADAATDAAADAAAAASADAAAAIGRRTGLVQKWCTEMVL